MKKTAILLFICIGLLGCKSGKNTFIWNESAAKNVKTSLFILNEHAKNAQNFETAIIKQIKINVTEKDFEFIVKHCDTVASDLFFDANANEGARKRSLGLEGQAGCGSNG